MEINQLANQMGRIFCACGILMLLIASVRGIRLQNHDGAQNEKVFDRITVAAIWITIIGIALQIISYKI